MIPRKLVRQLALIEIFLAAALAPMGCTCLSQKTLHTTLVATYKGVNLVDALVVPSLNTACVAEGKTCVKKGVTEKAKCTKLVECQKLYDEIVTAIKTGRITIGEIDAAIKKAASLGWLKLDVKVEEGK